MAEKMKGVVAQLMTTNKEGQRIESEIVFRPYCDWYIKPLHDYLAVTVFTDFEEFMKEFGIDVAQRVINGEVVEVTREPSPDMELRSCHRPADYVRINYETRKGFKEDLISKSTAKKLGYIGEE